MQSSQISTQRFTSPVQNHESILEHFTTSTPPQANSSRKRQKNINLNRVTATPSHQERMRSLFRDAASEIQPSPPQPRVLRELQPPNSETTQHVRPRLEQGMACVHHVPHGALAVSETAQSESKSVSSDSMSWASDADADARMLRAMSSSRISEQPPLPNLPSRRQQGNATQPGDMPNSPSREPLSSGFNSPNERRQPAGCSDLMGFNMGYTDGPDDEDMHSTHGVPLILPIAQADVENQRKQTNVNVKAWLDQTHDAPETLSRESVNNKENIPPRRSKSSYLSPTYSAHTSSGSPRSQSNSASPDLPPQPLSERPLPFPRVRAKQKISMRPAEARKPRPGTPRSLYNLPSTRKRLPKTNAAGKEDQERLQMATIKDEGESKDELADLSPSVARFRKGKGPRANRCASYFDEDVLPDLRKKHGQE